MIAVLRVIWFFELRLCLVCVIDFYCPVDIVNEIMPSGSGVDSSWDCWCVDQVLFETLINRLLLSG